MGPSLAGKVLTKKITQNQSERTKNLFFLAFAFLDNFWSTNHYSSSPEFLSEFNSLESHASRFPKICGIT